MAEEQKDNPKFEFKHIKLGENTELVLETGNPVKTGTGQYGAWAMWFVMVENVKATHGRKPKLTYEEAYTGKAIIFPATKLNENLIKAANGNNNVRVKVTKTAEETQKGLITNYVVEKLSDGEPSESSLTVNEQQLMDELSELKKQGYKISEDLW